MRSKVFAIVCGLVVASVVAAGALVFYDGSRSDLIAEGVTVNGVDVGGLKAAQARMLVRRTLLEPLERTVVVRHGERRFRLTAAQAKVDVDVDASVDRALDASRSGGVITRTWRSATGGRVERDVAVDIRYSRAAVKRLVERVSRKLKVEPRDADVRISASGVERKPSKKGRRVLEARLRRDVTEQLLATDGAKRVKARTVAVQPDVTTTEVARRYPAILIVNRSAFKLTLYKNLKVAKTYSIAVGQAGMDTPAGRYTIQNKAENPAWHVPQSDWAGKLAGQVIPPDDPRNPIEARWMGIYDGAGIHGTTADDSIGTAASHGCVRMRIPDVIELYDQVPVEAPVYIA
jgi:lipoprotein-anchoring transpeptidase ErfK/SrfK